MDLGCQDVKMKSVAVMSEGPACVCAQQCVIISDRPFVPAAAKEALLECGASFWKPLYMMTLQDSPVSILSL